MIHYHVNTNKMKNHNNIEGIQYLRAIAALMVLCYHIKISFDFSASLPTHFGYAGVDIFFVISGFVMGHSTEKLKFEPYIINRFKQALQFFRKRLIRIAPLYYLALIWVSRRELSEGVISLNLLKDFLFIPHPHHSYTTSLYPTLIPGWTLNYEMFFYLLFGASLILIKFQKLLLITSLITLSTIGVFIHASQDIDFKSTSSILSYFYTQSIILEFALGIIGHRIFTKIEASQISSKILVAGILIGFLLLIIATALPNNSFRGVTHGIPALTIVVLMAKACVNTNHRTLELLGSASYAIYLFHWPSFGAIKPLIKFLESSNLPQLSISSILIFTLLIVSISSGVLIHLLIEKKIQKRINNYGKNFISKI